MGKRVLFLKLIDLLIFSLLVKSQAGVDVFEEKNALHLTHAQEYYWIFLLNQKLNITLPSKRQDTLVRLTFWTWQVAWSTKRFYKEHKNRNSAISIEKVISSPVRWFRTRLESGDVKGWTYLKIFKYLRKFDEEVRKSDLPDEVKIQIIKVKDDTIKQGYEKVKLFMKQDFDMLDLEGMLSWYEITYQELTTFFDKLYLFCAGISRDDPRWEQTIQLSRKLVIIAAAHDDVSDIKSDLGSDGKLKEPNIFACFLNDEEKAQISANISDEYKYMSMEEVKEKYPRAYKKFMTFVKEQLRQIDLIPGVNLHDLLEYYFFYYPEYFMTHVSPDNPNHQHVRMDSLSSMAHLEKNISLIDRLRQEVEFGKKLNTTSFSKKYTDLVGYIFAQNMAQTGLSVKHVAQHLRKPVATISHWLHDKRVPLSLRFIRKTKQYDQVTLFYLCGIFAFSGSMDGGSLKLVCKDPELLYRIDTFITGSRDHIFPYKKSFYFRLYDKSLVERIRDMKKNLISALEAATIVEQDTFMQGIREIQTKDNGDIRIHKKYGPSIVEWIVKYLERCNKGVHISQKGSYSLIVISDSKERLVEAHDTTLWQRHLDGDDNAKNELIESYQNRGRSIIRIYFGTQKSEFWTELPGLMYICLTKILNESRTKKQSQIEFESHLKYQVLSYFREHFKTNIPKYTTHTIESDNDVVDESEGDWMSQNQSGVKEALEKLSKIDRECYVVLALRYGFIDDRLHTLTSDLSQRMCEMGICGRDGKPYSKSRTYKLLQHSLTQLKQLM